MLLDFVQRQRGMRDRAAGAHLRRNPDGLHDFFGCRRVPEGSPRMATDTIRALCHVRDRYGDQLLRLGGKGPLSEDALAEGSEGFGRAGSKAAPLLGNLASSSRV